MLETNEEIESLSKETENEMDILELKTIITKIKSSVDRLTGE
jgi:hypothetical protein